MHGTGKEILWKVLRNARESGAFNSIFGGEHTIVGRDKMGIKVPIDQPSQIVENMGAGTLRAWYDIEGSIENVFHYEKLYPARSQIATMGIK